MARKIDHAMAAERPEKEKMRELWADLYDSYLKIITEEDDVPLYLTLCGRSGGEIHTLIKRNLVKTTEVGGIAQEEFGRIVAVISSPKAALDLQKTLPGLKILDVDFKNIVRSDNPTSWPTGQDEKHCRAHIVNLDLNTTLNAVLDQGQVRFPILTWIQKLCQIHAKEPKIEWTLCLTLHAQIEWEREVCKVVRNFLKENFYREPKFAEGFRRVCGESLTNSILKNEEIDFRSMDTEFQQAILMVFVPKKIAQIVHGQGWCLKTKRNLRYGSEFKNRAPMVSWIINFEWDTRVSETPEVVYRDSLKNVFTGMGQISEDGTLFLKLKEYETN